MSYLWAFMDIRVASQTNKNSQLIVKSKQINTFNT